MIMHNKYLAALKQASCGFALMAMVSMGSAAEAETLGDAVRLALGKNPTIEQSIAAQESAHEDVTIERSAYFPTISMSTAAGRVYGDNATSRGLSTTRGSGYSGYWDGSVTVNQMLFDTFKTAHLVDAAKERVESANLDLKNLQESLALQTSLSYLNVMKTQATIDCLTSYQDTLKSYETRIGTMVGEGMADDAELQQAKALGIDVEDMLSELRGQLRASLAEYGRLTGHWPEGVMVRPASVESLLPPSVDDAIALAHKNHPLVQKLGHDIDAARLTRESQTSALFPVVTAELSSYKKDVADVIGGEVVDDRALVRLNWSLSAGGAEFAKIDKAHAEEKRAAAARNDVGRQLDAAIRTAYSDMETSKEQVAFAQDRLTSSEALLAAHKTQFEGGKVRILQILQTENQVLKNRMDSIGTEYRALAAQYSVLGSLGHLQETVLQTSPATPDAPAGKNR